MKKNKIFCKCGFLHKLGFQYCFESGNCIPMFYCESCGFVNFLKSVGRVA